MKDDKIEEGSEIILLLFHISPDHLQLLRRWAAKDLGKALSGPCGWHRKELGLGSGRSALTVMAP
jgi:hypothetical protein